MVDKNIKVLYLHSLSNPDDKVTLASYGVQKKITTQINALNYFFDCEEVILKQLDNSGIFRKIWSRLFFTAISERWEYNNAYKTADVIYFRKNVLDYSIIQFFKSIKKNNRNCIIIFEIPTYPYNKEEWKRIIDLPYKAKDFCNHHRLHKYVDLITSYGVQTSIFGIPTINLMNGIDTYKINKKDIAFHQNNIDIICMGTFADWHGYDRIIKGLNEYYKNSGVIKFHIHFVGEGVTIQLYKKMVKEYHLEDYVTFYGYISGERLNKVVNECDIGCDSLGTHRKNVYISSSLKSREYACWGLPIMGSEKIDFIDDDWPYFLKVERSDEPIDMFLVEKFYNKIKSTYDLATIIRDYSIKKIDINNAFYPVVQYILDKKKGQFSLQ